jgi:sporulenol synthase
VTVGSLSGDLLLPVEEGVKRCQEYLLRTQSSDGSWMACLEGSVLADSHFMIIDRLFNTNEKNITERLRQRILQKQLPNGGLSLYPGDGGHVSTTVEAYLALSMSGEDKNSPKMCMMREFVRSHGGKDALSNLTKITLAVCGQMGWTQVPGFPIEIIHFNADAPLSIYDFVGFTRVHIVPLLVLYSKRFSIPLSPEQGIKELWEKTGNERRTQNEGALEKLWRLTYVALLQTQLLLKPTPLRKRSLEKCERWILEHLEPDGTLGSYILSTFYGILALTSLGHKNDERIQEALKGLKGFIYDRDGLFHMQACSSTVWDTALGSYVLQESGIPPDHPGIVSAAQWLLKHRTTRLGDWRFHNPNGKPGCWGFQYVNELYPDVDDTAAAVLAIEKVPHIEDRDLACRQGIEWVLSMQNSDGGWSAFDRDCNKKWLEKAPFNDMKRALTDPSSGDMTGRTIEFLGLHGYTVKDDRIARAVSWHEQNQEDDGSWFGRWGIAYIYGTWAALVGLSTVGVNNRSPMVRSAAAWLESIQNPDGGWGESCAADAVSHYVPLGFSTPSQTAWATLGLIASSETATDSIQKGINSLLVKQRSDGSWPEDYPTGSGFAGKLYLTYHMYRNIWPLLALTRFRQKY